MKKAIDILKSSAHHLGVEAKMWAHMGEINISKKCRKEKKEILEAIKILKDKSNERTTKTSGRQPL